MKLSKGLSVSPDTLVTQLRDNLQNYSEKDIIRELLQNADDAGATRLYFYLLSVGETKDCHPLLTLPGLLVFNDGPLESSDVEAITRLIGGSKAQDEAKVGRFGLGLKSIFHICDGLFFDAFVPHSSDHEIQGGLFDPLTEARELEEYKKNLQQWDDAQTEAAIYKINQCLADILPESIKTGFFMLASGRTSKDGFLHIRDKDFSAKTLEAMLIESLEKIVPAFAQTANLVEIQAFTAPSLAALRDRKQIFSMSRTGKRFLGRPEKHNDEYKQCFDFKINVESQGGNSSWNVGGIECFDPNHDGLKAICDNPEWPKTGVDGKPEKGLPHAAITILSNSKSQNGISWRWASFYPLLADMAPISTRLEGLGGKLVNAQTESTIELLLHGYFFVKSDRKGIYGITAEDSNSIQACWNKSIKNQLLLPQLPEVLYVQFENKILTETQLEKICRWCASLEEKQWINVQKILIKDGLSEKWELLDVTGGLYEIPEGFSPKLKKWAEGRKEKFIFRKKGIYSKDHIQDWPDEILLSLLTHISRNRDSFKIEDVDFAEKLIEANPEKYGNTFKNWFIDLLGSGYFASGRDSIKKAWINKDLRDKLVAFADKNIRETLYVPQETENALRGIANKIPTLLKPSLLLPRSQQDTKNLPLPAKPGEQIIRLLKYLGNNLRDRENQQTAEIRLADYLRAGQMPPELNDFNLIRTSIFMDGKRVGGENDVAVSYKALTEKKAEGLLLLKDKANTVSDDLLSLLSEALIAGTEVWRPSENRGIFLSSTSPLDSGVEQVSKAIIENGERLAGDDKKRLPLFNKLLNSRDEKISSQKYKALRYLIAGMPIDDKAAIILGTSDNELVNKYNNSNFITVTDEWIEHLTHEDKKGINFCDSQEAREKIGKQLLRANEPWIHFEDFCKLFPDPRSIGDELRTAFMEVAWIPDEKKERGFKRSNILPDEPFFIYLEPYLPANRILAGQIIKNEWLAKMLKQLDAPNIDAQIEELLKDDGFKTPHFYFPENFDASQWEELPDLARLIKDDNGENTLLRHVLKLDKHFLYKFVHNDFEYDSILNVAYMYHKNNYDRTISSGLMAYLGAIITAKPDIFNEDYKFPTRKRGVWKKGNQILDDSMNADDSSLLPEKLWKIFHKNSISCSEDRSRFSSKDQKIVLQKFFSQPFCIQESRRIACFCAMIAGNHEDLCDYSQTWAQKGQSGIIVSKDFAKSIQGKIWSDVSAWQHDIHLVPIKICEVPLSLAGTPFTISQDERTFFTNHYSDVDLSKQKTFLIKLCVDETGASLAKDREEFCILLRNSMEYIAYLRGIDKSAINKIWEDNASEQFPLEETNRIIKHDLRNICRILKIKDQDIKAIELQMDGKIARDCERDARRLSEQLWDKAKSCPEILSAIQKYIQNSGYRVPGVLLELIQNADDALLQIAEPKNRKVKIELEENNLGFSHYGRPINYGDKEEYRQDLSNMLQFNGSEKDNTSATGKLGLGFKSVYLVTDEPWIQSGALSFRIINGLFPENTDRRMPGIEDDYEITKFNFGLKADITPRDLLARLYHAAFLIPVFSKMITQLTIVNKGRREDYKFNKPESQDDDNFIIDKENGILYFYAKTNDAALAMRIDKDGIPQKMEKTPPLWVTLPLSEGLDWNLGYAINGQFNMDSGRANFFGDTEDYNILVELGKSLSRCLDLWARQIQQENPERYQVYYNAMWRVLSSGLENMESAEKKKKILAALHTNDRGLSSWLVADGALGHGIPEAWSRPLADPKISLLMNKLCGEREFSEFVENLGNLGLADKLGSCGLMSAKSGAILRMLGIDVSDADEKQIFERIFKALTHPDRHLDCELFRACVPIYENLPQYLNLDIEVKTSMGSYVKIRDILLPPEFADNQGYYDYRDDFGLAAFAPAERILSRDYVHSPDEARLFVRLRGGRKIEQKEIADWIANAEGNRRVNALRYLANYFIANKPWDILKDEYSDSWINNRNEVTKICYENVIPLRAIIPELFMSPYDFVNSEADDSSQAQEDSQYARSVISLKEYKRKWEKHKETIKQKYVSRTYPKEFQDQKLLKKKLENNDPAAWQMLLFLGCLKSIGRMQDAAYRNFIDSFIDKHSIIFQKPLAEDDSEWLKIICDWQDANMDENTSSLFMEKLLYLHQISRFLTTYIETIKKAPQVGALALDAFSPRTFPVFSGSGKMFDAPPLPLKIGQYWVLRELSRLGVDGFRPKNEDFLKFCWVPRKECLEVFGIENGQSREENHNLLINKLKQENNGELPVFDYCFDIAICNL